MQCPLCKSHNHEVLRKPQRFGDHDIRLTRCQQCGIQFDQRSEIVTVYVLNPVTEESELIPIDRFEQYRAYLLNNGPHPARTHEDL